MDMADADNAKLIKQAKIDAMKAKGNEALNEGRHKEAVDLYSCAIDLDPDNHILYSNRSAAYSKCGQYVQALDDAEKTLELNPSWPKGYSRKGTALSLLNRYEEAKIAFTEGLAKDPQNTQLRKGIKMAESHLTGPAGSQPLGNPFAVPNLMARLEADPTTREFLKQPGFRQMMMELSINPSALGDKISDPRVMQTLSTLLGADLKVVNSEDLEKTERMETDETNGKTDYMETDETNEDPKSNGIPKESVSDRSKIAEALEEKQKGNVAYKAKDFEVALGHYGKAVELDPINITYRTNRSAVYFEQQEYDKCITECEEAIDIGREHRVDYKIIAKALGRIGNAYAKKDELQKAITFYNKSLSEHRDTDLVKKVIQVGKLLKERERVAYLDPQKAVEEKERGNELFQKGDYPGAVRFYTEAIKRNPNDPKIYSNRAACYTKLAELNLAQKDAEECIRLDPKFVKGYLRKGNILVAKKETDQARYAFQKALDLDQNCQEAVEGFKKCVMQDTDPESVKRRAMSDPEVQQILADPAMQMILSQMQKDPKALHEHLQNPEIASKIQKLIAVGIVSIR